ncbi:hypothetical protein [Massilia endophytica]|uniref:hypothetical protein n=1 Tax=Massilia endophytica TaxID=2899220 RepID=UPI001E2F9721|nr:hypothetical protein [Massilia endophytica]UGQ48007.1 hypothetical protein LSQ66_05945 [Massilia endophytica]
MKNEKLSTDEYNALEEVRRGIKGKPSACVGRNSKRLSGIKFISISRDGRIALTDKGKEALFLRRCILALRSLADAPGTPIDADVAAFLGKKSHIAAIEGGFEITPKGRESLADIESHSL